MSIEIIRGITIPFIGTCLGAGTVFFMKGSLSVGVKRGLTGFASGVMTAASVWSLIIPAIERSSALGALAFMPAAAGFWAGVLFLAVLGRCSSRLAAAQKSGKGKTSLLVLAVVIHNLPEGMAVGVVCAGAKAGLEGVTLAGALAFAVGIGIQNIPEGAIISMPLRAEGVSKGRSFLFGALSGAVEPVCAALTVLASGLAASLLPYLLSFAAGAMIYVVTEELVPETRGDGRFPLGGVTFAAGFTVMMALDVALG